MLHINDPLFTLADYAIVVASDAETGGTWAGAIETLKNLVVVTK